LIQINQHFYIICFYPLYLSLNIVISRCVLLKRYCRYFSRMGSDNSRHNKLFKNACQLKFNCTICHSPQACSPPLFYLFLEFLSVLIYYLRTIIYFHWHTICISFNKWPVPLYRYQLLFSNDIITLFSVSY